MKRHYSTTKTNALKCTSCRQEFPGKKEFSTHCLPRQGQRGRGPSPCKPQERP